MINRETGIQILVSLTFVTVVATLGSYITSLGLQDWYGTLVLPAFAPPGQVIGLVWTTLFVMLATAITISWNASKKQFLSKLAPLYFVNGLLNVLWSLVFFGMHNLSGAAVTSGLLGCSVLVLIFANIKFSKIAAGLLVPYFLWVSFATALNVQIVVLNAPSTTTGDVVILPGQKDQLPVEGVSNQVTGYGFTLTTGMTKKIDSHLTLKLDGVNDSRCPAVDGVKCIWAGELSPELTATLDGKVSQIRLGTTRAKEIDIGTYHVTLIDAGLESAKIKVTLP